MVEKLKNGYFKLKTYWRKPPRGYDVNYKEFLNLALGFGGISFLSVIIQWTTLAMSVHMMISYFKVSTGLVWFLGIIGSVIALIRSPIQSMIIDNSNSEKGKFKPFLVWTTIGTVVCFGLIPFIPNAWNSIILLSFKLPAMPIMGVKEASAISISLAVLIMFIMLQAGTFFQTILNQAMAGIEQTISTVAQERANIGSFKGLICNIPSSVVNIILPMLAGSMFAKTGGWNSIQMYRWVFPFCAVGALICIMFTVRGTKERVVVNKKYVAKVKFWEGAKELTKNKYFWILTIFNIAVGLRNYCNLTTWITQYSFQSDTAKTIVGLYCTTLLMNVLVLGMVFGPVLIKKFGKRNVLMVSNIGFAVMIGLQLIFYKNPVMILFSALLQNCFGGVAFIAAIMVSDVMDYMQWKTGKRLEGFWQNYSTFITTIIGVFTGMLLPLFLSLGGIGFADDIPTALRNTALRNGAFKYQTLLALIGSIVCMVPIFFYDLNEQKHADIVRVLKIRAATDNFNDGNLTEQDVINVKEISEYAAEKKNKFILDELNKYDFLDKITENYIEVKASVDKKFKEENIQSFIRDLDLEEKRLNNKLEKAQISFEKKKIKSEKEQLKSKKNQLQSEKNQIKQTVKETQSEFNREEFLFNQKSKERYFRYFASGQLAVYETAESIAKAINEIYPKLEDIWAEEDKKRKEEKSLKEQAKKAKKK